MTALLVLLRNTEEIHGYALKPYKANALASESGHLNLGKQVNGLVALYIEKTKM
jgi:hypothetical protein